MTYIPLIHELFKLLISVFIVVFIVLKWNDIKEIFCGEDGNMSSKRVIALLGMVTLCRLAIYTTKSTDKIDLNVIVAFSIIILTASAIATFPQIMDLFGKIKGVGTKEEKTINTNKSEIKSELNETIS